MEKLNWAMSYCTRPPELDMRICQEFSTLDVQQFPQLVELACAVKKRELTRIARAHAPEKHTPPAM